MQRVGWLLACLIGLLWLGAEMPGPEVSFQAGTDWTWRRTAHGWEQFGHSASPPDPSHPALHPGVVASAQLLISLLALMVQDIVRQSQRKEPF